MLDVAIALLVRLMDTIGARPVDAPLRRFASGWDARRTLRRQ